MQSSAQTTRARLLRTLPANDTRQDYVRAAIHDRDGEPWAEPFALQDSSMLSLLSRADCLIVRKPHAPSAAIGEIVETLRLP